MRSSGGLRLFGSVLILKVNTFFENVQSQSKQCNFGLCLHRIGFISIKKTPTPRQETSKGTINKRSTYQNTHIGRIIKPKHFKFKEKNELKYKLRVPQSYHQSSLPEVFPCKACASTRANAFLPKYLKILLFYFYF